MFVHLHSRKRMSTIPICLLISTFCVTCGPQAFGENGPQVEQRQPRRVQPPTPPPREDNTIQRLASVDELSTADEAQRGAAQADIKLRTKLVGHKDFAQNDAPIPPPVPQVQAPSSPAPYVDRPVIDVHDVSPCSSDCNCHRCNTVGPLVPCPVRGFHCVGCPDCAQGHKKDHFLYDSMPWQAFGPGRWQGAGPIPWEAFGHGEYIGPARTAHVPEYRLRVDDLMDFVFRLTREAASEPYRLEVGDQINVESLTAPELNREALVEPDGSITLRLLGQVPAYGMTLEELRSDLEERYKDHVQSPTITVSPIEINTRLEELRATVDNRFGRGGQSIGVRITPEGTLQLPAIGSVYAQGLSINELKQDIDARYRRLVQGLEVTPILQERAPRYVYVVGEVAVPGRYALVAPTSVMQAIALAGGWNVGGNLNHVVVFRRDENWNLMATKLDIFGPLYGKEPCPADEIWLRDSDIVVVPKRAILVADDAIELFFTRGLYGVVPVEFGVNFTKLSTL